MRLNFNLNRHIIFLIMIFSLDVLLAETHLITTNGTVEFEAVGRPSMIKINGKGEDVATQLKINQNKLSGEVVFKLSSLTTGIDERDKEMHARYLQTDKHPQARLIFNDFQMPAGWSLQNPKVVMSSFRGKLQLHGSEREVTGLYSIDATKQKCIANFEVKLSDFKIDTPVYLGVKVADVIKIKVEINKLNFPQ